MLWCTNYLHTSIPWMNTLLAGLEASENFCRWVARSSFFFSISYSHFRTIKSCVLYFCRLNSTSSSFSMSCQPGFTPPDTSCRRLTSASSSNIIASASPETWGGWVGCAVPLGRASRYGRNCWAKSASYNPAFTTFLIAVQQRGTLKKISI